MSTDTSTSTVPITVPEGFKLYTENNAQILLEADAAFLNPVQEFNRDLSVACINVWSEQLNKSKEERWRQGQERKAVKVRSKEESARKRQKEHPEKAQDESRKDLQAEVKHPQYTPHKVVILEALAATGLRSIRYAKEIPLVKYVLANDLSPAATEAMRRNIELNSLGPVATENGDSSEGQSLGKVRINEGDACTLMYNHRPDKNRVDAVDLDPYGTAAPFIDAAVQCIKDGGLLCVTCTDLMVLATNNYPEKCFSNYGGVPVKAEYCHEAALRLVLHSVSSAASKYGRYIEPLLSLSIDFYVRLFIRINTSPMQVKRAFTKTSNYYICTACQAFYAQPLGRIVERRSESSGNVNELFRTQGGPLVSEKCPECESTLHIAGPMWSGDIHDTEFVSKVLEHVESNSTRYGTATRMRGMLTVAKEELHTPFYFTPTRVANHFHCQTPSLDDVASALLHAGHKVSRSHACPGSIKTTATREDIHDVFRSFVKIHPINENNISENSPAKRLLAKEPRSEANFKHHPDSVTSSSSVKIVRYPETPRYWGPGTRATGGKNGKRKREDKAD
ncbi:trna (guanine-n2-)-methyltransferase [Moniliophthora roreri MCA 2997]|uniref:tRNA (guanine(26)-N(2))-dimethyltransferase n=1 Tax=Moniliophthora roreri (strain MCA 2997) TaxID=1381753 RepID=V2XVW5_MONRO|nr:trna (guanine-n2-)-methyltransferase [Moniliophthora roreri MCA 2997]